MARIRLYVESPLERGAYVALAKEQSHYLASVMRRKAGDHVLLFNGRDGEWLAEVISASKKQVELHLQSQHKVQYDPPSLTLCFAPVKNAPQHFLVQKAVELGVTCLQPILTRHTVVRSVNTEKLRANVIEAAEQCGRLDLPEVNEMVALEALLASHPAEQPLILCDESGGGNAANKVLSAIGSDKALVIAIGPEGGFSQEEFALLRQKPYVHTIGLGPRILRADTAALAALTLVQAFCGDWELAPHFEP